MMDGDWASAALSHSHRTHTCDLWRMRSRNEEMSESTNQSRNGSRVFRLTLDFFSSFFVCLFCSKWLGAVKFFRTGLQVGSEVFGSVPTWGFSLARSFPSFATHKVQSLRGPHKSQFVQGLRLRDATHCSSRQARWLDHRFDGWHWIDTSAMHSQRFQDHQIMDWWMCELCVQSYCILPAVSFRGHWQANLQRGMSWHLDDDERVELIHLDGFTMAHFVQHKTTTQVVDTLHRYEHQGRRKGGNATK